MNAPKWPACRAASQTGCQPIRFTVKEFSYSLMKPRWSGDSPQAGILIYTAAADSDGTPGGLVDLGKPENLGCLLKQALNRSKICSSDPLCSEHDPEKEDFPDETKNPIR
jgi:hypothetical protein